MKSISCLILTVVFTATTAFPQSLLDGSREEHPTIPYQELLDSYASGESIEVTELRTMLDLLPRSEWTCPEQNRMHALLKEAIDSGILEITTAPEEMAAPTDVLVVEDSSVNNHLTHAGVFGPFDKSERVHSWLHLSSGLALTTASLAYFMKIPLKQTLATGVRLGLGSAGMAWGFMLTGLGAIGLGLFGSFTEPEGPNWFDIQENPLSLLSVHPTAAERFMHDDRTREAVVDFNDRFEAALEMARQAQ